ncbi:DNA-directed RNA polymerase subunit omega [[Clostridium] aminophilum]|uniref:DNA-directed RNA polymerase subunit omega n=2 Tax=[Clostridium] aminophilum TaxID=1526 RepID=A0A1I6IN33_9FIRM|nr:DNA-directed RNA polymerase subunit omega [[Clostridium] aminophilum]SFR68143.1 DNA-directed RNA polymerase subunit omega [[Clostridium] aminophilum]
MMLRPSFNELVDAANKYSGQEEPVVESRYSIVIAAAKRARQLIDGDEPLVDPKGRKPLSIAIDEIYQGKVQILSEDDNADID